MTNDDRPSTSNGTEKEPTSGFDAVMDRLNRLTPEQTAELRRDSSHAVEGHEAFAQGMEHLYKALPLLSKAAQRAVPGARYVLDRIALAEELLEEAKSAAAVRHEAHLPGEAGPADAFWPPATHTGSDGEKRHTRAETRDTSSEQGPHATVAVRNAAAVDATRRVQDLLLLHQVMADMNTARSLADMLQTVADGMIVGLAYELACVNLVRPDGDLVVAAFAGNPAAEALITGRVGSRESWERRLSMGERWGDLVFISHTEGWILDDDVPQWPTDGPAPRSEDEWHPLDRLYAPMYASGTEENTRELIGVLSVDRPRDGRLPDEWARAALRTYASQASMAVTHARLRSNMQRAMASLEREKQAVRASEESFRQAFEYAPSGMAIAEIGGGQDGRILRTNDALCLLLGRPASAMRRYSFSDLVHPDDIGTLQETSAEGGRAQLRLSRRDGSYVWVSLRNSVVADAADGPRFLLTHVEDIEERKRRELQLAHRASHDSLTGLPNSAELRSRLHARVCQHPQEHPGTDNMRDAAEDKYVHDPTEYILERHSHLSTPEEDTDGSKGLAVLFCGLDSFKSINDRFGHATGDLVLLEVARRLSRGVRDGDTVARLGGDEFVILADGLGRADAQDLAVRLRNGIIQPIKADGRAVRVGASFGIGWARCGMTADEVLKAAEERRHVEKRRPRSKQSRQAS